MASHTSRGVDEIYADGGKICRDNFTVRIVRLRRKMTRTKKERVQGKVLHYETVAIIHLDAVEKAQPENEKRVTGEATYIARRNLWQNKPCMQTIIFHQGEIQFWLLLLHTMRKVRSTQNVGRMAVIVAVNGKYKRKNAHTKL